MIRQYISEYEKGKFFFTSNIVPKEILELLIVLAYSENPKIFWNSKKSSGRHFSFSDYHDQFF